MAVNTMLQKVSIHVRMSDGVDSNGTTKYVGMSLGTINPETFDVQKAMNIVNKLADCITKGISYLQKTEVSRISS